MIRESGSVLRADRVTRQSIFPARCLYQDSFAVISQLSQAVLQAGLDDWVPLAAVDILARQISAHDNSGSIERGLAAIRELVQCRLAVVGEVSDGGFFEWNEPLKDALARIEDVWQTQDLDRWGFVCWLRNTPDGDAQARQTIARQA